MKRFNHLRGPSAWSDINQPLINMTDSIIIDLWGIFRDLLSLTWYCNSLPAPLFLSLTFVQSPLSLTLPRVIISYLLPCYQRGSPCQDPAGIWTAWRSSDDRKEAQTAAVWSCFPFIRSSQNHFARHSERGQKTRRTKEEVGRQHQGMDRPGVRQASEGSGEQGKMEKASCKIIRDAPKTLAVKGLMIVMMMMND